MAARDTAWQILGEMLETNADLVEAEAKRVRGGDQPLKNEAAGVDDDAVDDDDEAEDDEFNKRMKAEKQAQEAAEHHLTAEQELSEYKKARVPEGVKCLDWWRANAKTFPRIALLARMILASPASSAPSERVFSKLNIVVQRRTARLDPQRAGRRVFLCGNGKYFDKPRLISKKKRKHA
jgi:hypothetical protein